MEVFRITVLSLLLWMAYVPYAVTGETFLNTSVGLFDLPPEMIVYPSNISHVE